MLLFLLHALPTRVLSECSHTAAAVQVPTPKELAAVDPPLPRLMGDVRLVDPALHVGTDIEVVAGESWQHKLRCWLIPFEGDMPAFAILTGCAGFPSREQLGPHRRCRRLCRCCCCS